jgi:hypothetical protein
MAGLDCGTVSSTAWPILSKGFRASLTVSDFEAHSASVYLESQGLPVGPCGASTVAALRRLSAGDKVRLGINSNSVIVLPCTEACLIEAGRLRIDRINCASMYITGPIFLQKLNESLFLQISDYLVSPKTNQTL